ncbi:MAG TPA: NADH-quinone oxidoreductase subunit C [Dehalococcoidales bacterium]
MTVLLSANEVAKEITKRFPQAQAQASNDAVLLKGEALFEVAAFLKNSPEFGFNYLNYITAVDYFDYFELVYQLTSLSHNHTVVLKTRCYDRNNPVVSSVVRLWRGADLQEREVYDLMGIRFNGHPNMKRIVLWDGFQGHPLRKDYL